jgi:hypothetical protein
MHRFIFTDLKVTEVWKYGRKINEVTRNSSTDPWRVMSVVFCLIRVEILRKKPREY